MLVRDLHLPALKGNFSSTCQGAMWGMREVASKVGVFTHGVRRLAQKGSAEGSGPGALTEEGRKGVGPGVKGEPG